MNDERSLKRVLLNYSNIVVLVLAMILLFVIIGSIQPAFLKPFYVMSQLTFVAETSLIGLGMTLVILMGCIDLSVGSMMALSCVVLGMLCEAGVPSVIAVILTLLLGAVCGFLNGFLVCNMNVAPLIVTLGTMGLYRGIAMGTTGGNAKKIASDLYFLGSGKIGNLPISMIIAVALYLVALFVVHRTNMGMRIKMIGYNSEASRFAGVSVNRDKIKVYIISAMLASLMGIIYSARVTSAKADYGSNYEMNAITIAVFGGAVLSGGKASILGSFIATIIIVLLKQGLTLIGIQSDIQAVIVGLILIFAVAFNTFVNNTIKKIS